MFSWERGTPVQSQNCPIRLQIRIANLVIRSEEHTPEVHEFFIEGESTDRMKSPLLLFI